MESANENAGLLVFDQWKGFKLATALSLLYGLGHLICTEQTLQIQSTVQFHKKGYNLAPPSYMKKVHEIESSPSFSHFLHLGSSSFLVAHKNKDTKIQKKMKILKSSSSTFISTITLYNNNCLILHPKKDTKTKILWNPCCIRRELGQIKCNCLKLLLLNWLKFWYAWLHICDKIDWFHYLIKTNFNPF